MGNTIEYAKIFTKLLDEIQIPGKTTAAMETNPIQYNGGDEIKVPKMSLSGLADYDRGTGYVAGNVVSEYETHKITKDRGIAFTIDEMDLDESGFVVEAGRVVAMLNKEQVVPEVDAYRYSKIFSLANANLKTKSYTPADGTIFEQLALDLSTVENIIGEEAGKKIYMSYESARILDMADKVEKKLDVVSNNGAVKTKTRYLDGVEIIRVPASRFKSAFTFNNGTSSFGFTASATAMNINWIILPDAAPYGVMKHDKLKVFAPGVNQKTDGWLIQYRLYHDLFIPDNKIPGMLVSYTAIAAPALTATFDAGAAAGTKATVTGVTTGNTLAATVTATADATPDFNSIVDKAAYVSGADIAATAGKYLNVYELDANKRVVRFVSHLVDAAEVFA